MYQHRSYITQVDVLKFLEQQLGEIVPLDAFKPTKKRTYVAITPLNFNIRDFLNALKHENAVLIGIMDQNRDLRFLMMELDKVGLKVYEVFKEIQTVNPKVEYRSLIEKTEKEYLALDLITRSNVRFLFDMITYGIYDGDYVIRREWISWDLDFGGFAKVEGKKILPNVEKLRAIFNEDWSKERILGVMKKLSNNYKPFYLLSKTLDDRVRYLGVMSDDIRESLEVALTWAVNLAREQGEIFKTFEILMYYRIAFAGFGDNLRLGILDGEYILEKFKGKLDLETELKITNILGILNLYSENYTYAEYYLRDVIKRGEGVLRDMALLNLGVLEGRKGNLKAEYEIYRNLIEKSSDRRVVHFAIRNILVLYDNPESIGVEINLAELKEYFNKGIRIVREVKDVKNEFWIRYNFAVILERIGEFKEAMEQIDEMLKITKNAYKNEYADAMALAGYIYYKMGDYQKALQTLSEAIQNFDLRDKNLERRYYLAKANYAEVLAKLGKVKKAAIIVKELEEKISDLSLYPEIAESIKNTIRNIRNMMK